ncbi:large conductance mechanosensitive channel protein MscL [Candidatus Parcubacteria bacterium]|nr:MAG: large conductance mechanosensitive channel protein MscL [Candidatus Parcubacteria bacterium]
MLKDFKNFAVKGNVVDLAVAVIIGTAFGKIVSSFVADIIMPPIGVLLGGVDFSNLKFVLKDASEAAELVSINYGLFINSIIDFIIIAFVIFMVIKQLERFKKKEAEKPAELSEDILLLREIRDNLKTK